MKQGNQDDQQDEDDVSGDDGEEAAGGELVRSLKEANTAEDSADSVDASEVVVVGGRGVLECEGGIDGIDAVYGGGSKQVVVGDALPSHVDEFLGEFPAHDVGVGGAAIGNLHHRREGGFMRGITKQPKKKSRQS